MTNSHELNHIFTPSVAAEHGLPEAVVIHHFQYWISHNANTSRNFKEGRTWMYQTIEDIASRFEYFSTKQIERIVEKLVKTGVLRKGNFNSTSYDRTLWYAFENEEMFGISRNREMEKTKSGNGNPGIGKSILYTDTKHIPPSPLPPQGEERKEGIIRFNFKEKRFENITPELMSLWEDQYGDYLNVLSRISEFSSHLREIGEKNPKNLEARIPKWLQKGIQVRSGNIQPKKPKETVGYQSDHDKNYNLASALEKVFAHLNLNAGRTALQAMPAEIAFRIDDKERYVPKYDLPFETFQYDLYDAIVNKARYYQEEIVKLLKPIG